MDGVLADFEYGFLESWRRRYPRHPGVALDARNTFSIRENYPAHLAEEVKSVYGEAGFFRNLTPIVGALHGAREMLAAGHDVRICTSPLTAYRHCVLEKYQWVEAHLGPDWVPRLILTKDKTVVHGDVLVDDNPQIIGSMPPSWVHVIFEQPYNVHVRQPKMTWATWRERLAQVGVGSRSSSSRTVI
jgi:5'-nucleotidase